MGVTTSKYDQNMGRRDANYVPLTPLSFLQRTAGVFPERDAIRYEGSAQSWSLTFQRCCRLADALRKRGVGKNDTVSVLCPNTPPAIELSFAVSMAGAVVNMINTRLDAEAVAFILDHAEASVFLVEQRLHETGRNALARAQVDPLVVDIEDPTEKPARPIGALTYESLIAEAMPMRPGPFRVTSGTPSPSTTPREPPATRRGSFTTTAGPTSTRWAMPWNGRYRRTRSISGRCLYSTATDGAFPGRSPPSGGPTSACRPSTPRPSTTSSPPRASPICAGRRSWWTWSPPRPRDAAGNSPTRSA